MAGRVLFACAVATVANASAGSAASAAASGLPQVQAAPSTSADPDWRRPDPEDTVYFELPSGRVVLELAPEFAPRHAAQIRRLVRAGYFDGGAVVRSQDNYVAQWGVRPAAEGEAHPSWVTDGLAPEFERQATGLSWAGLADRDTYAAEVGFVNGFPAARTAEDGRTWIVHCYGVVGVGRDTAPDSGNAAELYAVTGQAPRHLDRNLSMVGRILLGMELLTTLPRGTEALGFYAEDEETTPIRAARVAADVPEAERSAVEVMRTDTETFRQFVASRRTRTEAFFVQPAGAIDVCNVRLPTRIPAP